MIYLDYNATTPLHPRAAEAMMPSLQRVFGNPSSIHGAGRLARATIDDSRERIAAILGAKPHEIVFTSGGTESDNLGVIGLARSYAEKGHHIITSRVEHHAVLHAFEFLEKNGFKVTWVPVDSQGRVDPAEVESSITPETTLVSVIAANNETGTIQPVQKIAQLCRDRGVHFHSDMIQSFGKIPLNVRETGADAISLAAHKFYGPKGAGLLWLRSGLSIDRLHHGGFHEGQRRPGTENVAAIAGMAEAAELAVADLAFEQARQAELRDHLWTGIRKVAPDAVRNGHADQCLSNTLNVSFPGADGESLLINLDLEGIYASSGSACMAGSIMPSHVLLAMGVRPELAQAAVRFSLGRSTTRAEIDETIAVVGQIMARIQPATM